MWASDTQRNQISLLGLVASDFAYKRGADIVFDPNDPARGEFLASHPDSTPNDEYSFPPEVPGISVDPGSAMFGLRVDQTGVGVVVLPNWRVFNVIERGQTGFGVVIFRGVYSVDGQTRTDYVVAFRGTDGRNGQDWLSNIQLGQNQWREAANQLSGELRGLTNADNSVFSGTIHFTGQSLGGGLAQYAAYEYARGLGEAFDSSRITLTTFNAFAGGAGLLRAYGADPNTGYHESDFAGVSTAHYTIANDIVHALGAAFVGRNVLGHLNARDGNRSNLFHFDQFRAFENGQAKTGEQSFLDLVDGHRIETGFYAGLDRYQASFMDANVRSEIAYVDAGDLQQVGEVFARVFGGDRSNNVSAWSRVAAGTLIAGLIGNPKQFQALLDLVADSLYHSDTIDGVPRMFIKSGIPNLLLKAFALPVIKIAGASLFVASLADLMDKRSAATDAVAYSNTFLPVESAAKVVPMSEQEVYRPQASATRFGVALAAINPEAISDPGLQAIAEEVQSLDLDLQEFGTVLYAGGDWLYNTAHYLHVAAREKGVTNETLALFDANLTSFFASQIDIAGTGDDDFISSARTQLAAFVREDLGWALANANVDFTRPYQVATNAFAATVNDFQDYSRIEAALQATLGDPRFTRVHGLIEDALATSHQAWQSVAVVAGHSANPFEGTGSQPNQAPIAAGHASEGSAQVFTAYIPFEAGAGGQAIRFTLGGEAADKLKVLGGEEIELAADGTFTLTVAEGQREISFAIAALEDVDADESFTVFAQLVALVDGVEVATHLEQEEATLLLDAEDEAAPAGGMEYHGDWGLKLFPSTNPDGTPLLDKDGNQVFHTRSDLRYPPFTNLERDPSGRPDLGETGPITGIDGADHIWLGEFGGSGWAIGMGGDDYFEGMPNVPNFIIGDDSENLKTGNDTIEGGENLRPYSDPGFTREGEHIEGIGDDIVFGGPGDDDIYADRIALLEQTLDPGTPALDQKGDWITGEQGDDRIFGSAAHDALFGGGGADEIHGGAGDDVLDGDDSYRNWGDAWWEFDPGFFGVTFFPVTNVRSQSSFDYYKDVGGDDVLDGGAGDDLVLGMLGDDTLIGGLGRDRLEGWEGDDQLFGGAEDDVLAGDFGRYETAWFRTPGANFRVMPGAVGLFFGDGSVVDQVGNDFLDGGAGNDQLFGEAGDDVLLGRDGADFLFGDADYLPDELHGNDRLDGGTGADSLSGNAGDDRLFGGADDDSLSGGAGNDQADGGSGDDSVSGGEGDDVLKGGDGVDTLAGDAGSDVLDGDAGNDRLAGGEGDDVLRGGAGADSLDGGAGADSLYGGSGEDVVAGGEGNDLVDGGAGADVARGGAGDDTYVFGLGYGADRIEDGAGSNRLSFGAGIAPDDLSATLDGATLSATIAFGGAGDSATLDMNAFRVGGVDFAGGATWGRKEFLGFMPALASAGSDSADVLVGNENLRNELRGLGGDDDLAGSANDDLLDGGAGADRLDGAGGSDLYVFAASDSDVDALADSDVQARAYLDWYYGNLGIPDWIERGQYGGKYQAVLAGWGFIEYFDSFDEAFAAIPSAEISLVEPLPSVAPLVRRDDQAALDQLVTAGVLSRDVAEFGPGLALSDLTLSVTVNAAEAASHPEQPWYSGGTLSVAWGSGGFHLEVPGIDYGFAGSNLLKDDAWRGYRLGEGVEAFLFADGPTYSLEELLRQAVVIEVVSDYRFSRNSGGQLISRGYGAVRFDDDIRWEEITVSRDGVDLLLSLADGSAQGRIQGWYADPDAMPQLTLQFSSDPEVDAGTLTELGLRVNGSEADDVLTGTDGFGDTLYGAGGNDVLDGGGGKDTYIFRRGDGNDRITEIPAGAGDPEASVIVLTDFSAWEAHFGLGSLLIDLGGGDAIHFTGFDPLDPHSTPVFDRLVFAGGESLSYDDALERGFEFFGAEEDDVFIGTAVRDFMDGAGGNDIFEGLGGDDLLLGGEGSDVYLYSSGDGNDLVLDWDDTPGEADVLRLQGMAPEQVHVTRDRFSHYLVFENGERVMLDSAAREAAAEIERVEFDDGTVWTPSDLAGRVALLPGTERADALWGTSQGDVIYGFGGEDELFGNGGDDFLAGGEGVDIYSFAPGDGADVVDNYDEDGSPDQISFTSAASTDVTLTRRGNDLVLKVENGGNEISLRSWYGDANRKIDSVYFGGDFMNWDAAMLEELAPAGAANNAPEVANPLADQAALEDEAFGFSIPQGSFADPDADELVYSASLIDGAQLPAWLSFDPERQLFSGTPANSDVAVLGITVTATDTAGEAASDSFTLEVVNANDAPVVTGVIADVHGREGEALAFNVSPGIFSDPDADDHLSLSAAVTNGSALPGWLSFDGTSFRGTPGFSDAGEYVIEVTGTDAAGASAATSFRLTVDDVPVTDNRLIGTSRHDVLVGTAADEVLVGGGGNDLLIGGGGDDVYVHGLRGGQDEIVEAGGDFDVIRFGDGITRDMVRVRRRHDDLVLDIAGPHGSVTVRDWFASPARRVEFVQFASGDGWNEDIIRRLVRKGDSDDGHHHHKHLDRDCDEKPSSRRAHEDRQAGIVGYRSREESFAAIWERLSSGASFDFEALLREAATRKDAPSPQEIARQWARAHGYASALAFEADDAGSSISPSVALKLAGPNATGFGFEASIGASRTQDGLKALEGLIEGFRKL